MQEIVIHTEKIKLDQFLKWIGIAETGGMAKEIIRDNRVRVNDAIETQRGKTLKPGDMVEVLDKGTYRLVSE